MYPLLVVAGLVFHHNKLLITQRPPGKKHAGYWEFPGGKLEKDESPVNALIRELCEEIDLKVAQCEIFDVVYHRYDEQPVLLMVYRCQSDTNRVRHLEVSDHAWIDVEERHNYSMLPADHELIEQVIKKNAPQ